MEAVTQILSGLGNFLVAQRLYVASALIAFLLSVLLTPLIRRLAVRLDLVDCPDKHRKLHARTTALGGGVAIFLAFSITLASAVMFSDSQGYYFATNAVFVVCLVVASFVICLVGLIDDRYDLRGRQKLVGQLIAASIVVAGGLCIPRFAVFGWMIELGPLAVPFTLFWLLGAINALNLIDGVDGLATSVGLVLSMAIGTIAILLGHRTEAFLALSMAGALAGFLFYNRSPASIFLGDSGSMLVGLVLAALAMRGAFKGPATAAMGAPLALWAIPIFDVVTAILRRKLTGRSIYISDRAHFHHTLLKRGFSHAQTVLIIGGLCLLTALGAVLSVLLNNDLIALGAVVIVVAAVVLSRSFGHHESRLLVTHLGQLGKSLIPRPRHRPALRNELQTHFEGNLQWKELWATLTEFAERFDVTSIQLNVMVPTIGEEFHASWQRNIEGTERNTWHSEIPLLGGEISIGRLKIAGVCGAYTSVCGWMGDLIGGLRPFEVQLEELVRDAVEQKAIGSGSPIVAFATAESKATALSGDLEPTTHSGETSPQGFL